MKLSKTFFTYILLLLSACSPAPDRSTSIPSEIPNPTTSIPTDTPTTETTPTLLETPVETNLPEERVEFESGFPSVAFTGTLQTGETKDYVLTASAGQSIHIKTIGSDSVVQFTLKTPKDGYWDGELTATDGFTYTAQISLPEDGDYVVRLSIPQDAKTTVYDVLFTVVGDWMTDQAAERIDFGPDTQSIEHISILPSGLSIKQYVLAAEEGQQLIVDFITTDVPVGLYITNPGGLLLSSDVFPAVDSISYRTEVLLPETGDYLITLVKADHTPSTQYTAEFSIQ